MTRAIQWSLGAFFVSAILAVAPAAAQTCSTWCRCDDTPKLKGCTAIRGMTVQVCGNAEPPAVPTGCVCIGAECVNNLDPTNAATDPTFFMGCPSVVGALCN